MTAARATRYIDDDRVRVTEWRFALAGEATDPHVHEFDYVVVPITGGELAVVTDDGAQTQMLQQAGIPYRGFAGTRHNVVSQSGTPVVFVEVELKTSVLGDIPG